MELRGGEVPLPKIQVAESDQRPGAQRVELDGPGQGGSGCREVAIPQRQPALLAEDQRTRRLGLRHRGQEGALVVENRGIADGEDGEDDREQRQQRDRQPFSPAVALRCLRCRGKAKAEGTSPLPRGC
jgi:hypothetical protein